MLSSSVYVPSAKPLNSAVYVLEPSSAVTSTASTSIPAAVQLAVPSVVGTKLGLDVQSVVLIPLYAM